MNIEIAYHPEPHQLQVHEDTHRYRVVCAGRKFGKSVLARQELIRKALYYQPVQKGGVYQPGNFWIVSPTIKQGRQNHWLQLIHEIPKDLVKTINKTELSIELFNEAHINILGAENADKIRGAGVEGMVVDEAAYISEKVWEFVLEPELFSTKGWALFISTPKGYNWFEDLFQKGREGSDTYDKNWASWHFTSYDTPRTNDPDRKAFLDKKQEESATETFAQEYLADFTKLEGLIYKEFNQNIHVVDWFDIPREWDHYRAIDWGAKEPTVVLFLAVSPEGHIYVTDEIYETDKVTSELAEEIKSKSYGRNVVNTFADPSGRQNILNLSHDYQIPVQPASREMDTTKKNWVNLGIDKVKELLKGRMDDGKPPLMFLRGMCENTLREIQLYSWKENPKPENNSSGMPEDANNHCLDSLRYFSISYQKMDDYFPEGDVKDWSFS